MTTSLTIMAVAGIAIAFGTVITSRTWDFWAGWRNGGWMFPSLIGAIALMLLFTLGCRLGSGPVQPSPQAGDPNTKLVTRVIDVVGEHAWQRTGYARPDDAPGWPWFIIVAGDGTGCPSFAQEIYVPRSGEFFTCKVRWRIRRPL